MPRVAFNIDQKKAYKLKDFKGWVVKQMKLTGKNQSDVAEALGITQSMVSKMLKIPRGKEKSNPDPFSYGQVITLCELFDADENERKRLLIL